MVSRRGGTGHLYPQLFHHRFSGPSGNTYDPVTALLKATRLTFPGNIDIECLPVASVAGRYTPGREIEFPNIDRESHNLAVLRLDWKRHRPTVIPPEDLEERETAAAPTHSPSEIRAYLTERGYALDFQLIFSFLSVDRFAFNGDRETGFDLSRSQLLGLHATWPHPMRPSRSCDRTIMRRQL